MCSNGWSLGRGKPGITALLPLKVLMAARPRRAFLARPRTVADVGSVVASMKRLGLNQLWLDVFSGGHAHLDVRPLAPNTGGTGGESLAPPLLGAGGTPDILAEALARTKGTGIAVIPALRLALLRRAHTDPLDLSSEPTVTCCGVC